MPLPRPLSGAAAGFTATFPMSLAMLLMHKLLPDHERYPLPPEGIAARLEAKSGAVSQLLDPKKHKTLTVVSHFAFGTVAGALYGGLPRQPKISPIIRGLIFGMLVWTISYSGLLPAINLYQSAAHQPMRRNLLMITAHLIWGSVLGWLTEANSKAAN